ncbi:xanthine dehydrogenase accessory protein XdhC [Luteolibacter pohnpeiensis]|uniref:Xanthine dehydrogenase accessory protein XdhC n=1 Tax=Luteolibacter pohnpeiensis TaxID=454153 RepID=A0A934S2W4_9BACT|nr:xanthine dehydrogenase accessory protein XdhC [Luteolibacter pohnpeiensis]MBK1880888.1 xanthine dehydrogenase accessory protein XdhC [Luteolibacter pohnpeiensis]
MFWQDLQALHENGVDFVVVTVIATRGSVPADPGAKMIVTSQGLHDGTVGGGKIEARAISQAVELLESDRAPACQVHVWNLQRDIGMTCGGEMTLLFELHRALPVWRIFIFGAGHVVQALVPVLLTLPCRVQIFEERTDWLAKLPEHPNLEKTPVVEFQDGVSRVTPDGYVLSITRGHSSDLPVLRKLYESMPKLPWIGVIGSAAKRAVIERDLRQAGVPESAYQSLHCPLGLPLGGNTPAEIAISIAAQLLQIRDKSDNIA